MYQRILVAIDSSTTAAHALDVAIDLAKRLGAALCIVHAEDESLLVQHGMGIGTFIDIDQTKAAIRATADALLGAAAEKASTAGVVAERRFIDSDRRRVAELVVETARDWSADLIVAGTHGRRGVERLLVGSVAENLLRFAETAVLLVRDR